MRLSVKVRHDRGLGHEHGVYERCISLVANNLRKGAVFFDYNDDMIAFRDRGRGGVLCEGKTTRKNSCEEKESHPKASQLLHRFVKHWSKNATKL
jgi:hypothetical protein